MHQFYINEDWWPVAAPYRYVGNIWYLYRRTITGIYKYKSWQIYQQRGNIIRINSTECYNTIQGIEGTWKPKDDGRSVEIIIGEDIYKGVFNIQWDEYGKKNVMTFTALSDKGVSIWGSGIWAIE